MSTGCHGSQTRLRCASLLRMPTTHSSPLRRRALPSLLTGLLACAGSTATVDVSSAGAAVPSGTVAAGAPVPSAGCRLAPGPTVTNLQQNLTIQGVSRFYLLTTPAPSTPSPTPSKLTSSVTTGSAIPRPLVVDFHGLAEGATLHAQTSQFGALGQKDGFVAVFPNGTGSPVQWNTTDQAPTNPDLEFVTALLKQVESSECIDTSRVYASGFSDGSFMVSLLACTMSNTFAAIGAVSGLQLPKPCRTTRRVPIITFHGTADPILYFNGGIGTGLLNSLFGQGGSTSSRSTTSDDHTAGQTARPRSSSHRARVGRQGRLQPATRLTPERRARSSCAPMPAHPRRASPSTSSWAADTPGPGAHSANRSARSPGSPPFR